MDKYDILETDKFPTSMSNYLGIEIEFLTTCLEDDLREWLVNLGLQYNTHLGGDGSIDTYKPVDEATQTEIDKLHKKIEELEEFKDKLSWGTPKYNNIDNLIFELNQEADLLENESEDEIYAFELRVLVTEKDLKIVTGKLKTFFSKCDAFVNSSCGLHVHVDMRQREPKKAFARLMSKQDEMYMMSHPSRKENTYCKPTQAFDQGGDRYRCINTASIQEHNTIEVRVHEGCIDMKNIYMWCKYLIYTVDGVKLTKELSSYVRSKISKNATKTA